MLIEFKNSNHCNSNPTFRYQRTWWHYLAIKLKNTSSAGQLCINSVYQSLRQLEHQTTPPRPASQLGWLARSSCEPEMSTRSIEIRDRSRNIAWTIIVHHTEKTLKMTIVNLRHFTEKLIGQKPWVGISSRRFCTAMSTDLSIWPAPVFGILRRCSSIMISNLGFCCAHVVISLNFDLSWRKNTHRI